MPTYIYETIPSDPDTAPRRFEIFQKISDEHLKSDPVTNELVRRIIAGSFSMKRKIISNGRKVNKSSAAAIACGCGTGQSHGHNHRRHSQSNGVSSHTHTYGHNHKK